MLFPFRPISPLCHCEPVRRLVWQSVPPCHCEAQRAKQSVPLCHCEVQRAAAISRYHLSSCTADSNLVPGDSHVAPLLGMTGKTQHLPITLSLRGPKGRGNLPVPSIDPHRRLKPRTRRFPRRSAPRNDIKKPTVPRKLKPPRKPKNNFQFSISQV